MVQGLKTFVFERDVDVTPQFCSFSVLTTL